MSTMILTRRQATVWVCLAAGLLLGALPTLADSPSTSTTDVLHWYSVVLQHSVPDDILRQTHWDQAANLPTGVKGIYTPRNLNSLLIRANSAGLAKVRQVVTVLDVPTHPVQVKMALAMATEADLKASGIKSTPLPPIWLQGPMPGNPPTMAGYANGPGATLLLQTLQKAGAVIEAADTTTFADFADKEVITEFKGKQLMLDLPALESFTVAVTSHINKDGSLTLALRPRVSWHVSRKARPDSASTITTETYQDSETINRGDTLMFTNLFAGAVGKEKRPLLLFVTPTVLPDENSIPTMPKK